MLGEGVLLIPLEFVAEQRFLGSRWLTGEFRNFLQVEKIPLLGSGPQHDLNPSLSCRKPSPRSVGGADRGMYFILRLTQLIVRLDSRLGVLRYRIAHKCLLPGPFGHSGVGGNPGVEGIVRSYNLAFTYPCQGGRILPIEGICEVAQSEAKIGEFLVLLPSSYRLGRILSPT